MNPSRPAAVPAPTPSRPRIFVVEDHANNCQSLRLLLEVCGCPVEVAEVGLRGVEKALASPPNVAVVDIGLLHLDGYEVARRLRAACGGAVLLVAVSGWTPWRPASTTTYPSRLPGRACPATGRIPVSYPDQARPCPCGVTLPNRAAGRPSCVSLSCSQSRYAWLLSRRQAPYQPAAWR